MGSTFSGLEISKRGLSVHQTALNTTGHNISNADNKDYARQRVKLQSADPIYAPSYNRASGPGQLGQGSVVAEVQRVRDAFHDDQIISAENSKSYWETRHLYFIQMENVFNEPSDNTLRSRMNKFWSSWQELASFPGDVAHREVVLERASSLVVGIQDTYRKLNELRQRANLEVKTDVEQINSISSEIRDLNVRIMKLQGLGDNPNDLMDRRDAALEKLSRLVDIRIGRGDRDELFVFIGEQALIQGEIQRPLGVEPDPSKEGFSRVFWEHNQRDVILKDGRLYSLLEVRDRAILDRISEVDSYAINLADIVNEAHRDGFGLDASTNKDFFGLDTLSLNANAGLVSQRDWGNYDLNQDGTAELTAVFRVTGTNVVDPKQRLGIAGTLTFFRNDRKNTPVNIDYRADETLHDVIKKINNTRVGVVAFLNHDNQLALKATTSSTDTRTHFMIRHIEDSGELLVGHTGILTASGVVGAFDYRRIGEISKFRSPLEDITLTPIYHPSAHIEIAKDVQNNPAAIAAGRGIDQGGTGDYNTANGIADGSNALIIAGALKQDARMIGHAKNPEEFYNALISRLGTESRTAEDAFQRYQDDLVELNSLRQSVMGVSLDEEMSQMIQFQHAYNASARMLQTQNNILDVIINRIGSV